VLPHVIHRLAVDNVGMICPFRGIRDTLCPHDHSALLHVLRWLRRHLLRGATTTVVGGSITPDPYRVMLI
jgi:hypothetical protein